MLISLELVLIRSKHNLLRFSLLLQARETLIRNQQGKCKTKRYGLLPVSFVCFGLYTGKPSADTVIRDLKASYGQDFALFISSLLFCFVGVCSLVLVWTSGDKVFSIMDIKYKSPTLITMI